MKHDRALWGIQSLQKMRDRVIAKEQNTTELPQVSPSFFKKIKQKLSYFMAKKK